MPVAMRKGLLQVILDLVEMPLVEVPDVEPAME
jgi:hypothetical protein